ncbi:Crp/Fnr family transcriptional regulator [Chondromyces crocatus]|uniref:cAMP phosphodiesterase n=1 Tax=Chondromyces crocatus TaxID=52 RepID=A0A0K1EJQ9_CHOCO|nr:Crp/Fnr family transcriptional regulator [Chondromyces crocatus]AKT40838.1 cAMP phosphodiesterase [Chondromyces crocatus]
MMMGKDATARNVRVQPGALAADGALDLDARKRRIIRRGALGNAASPASQTILAEAGTIQRIAKGRPLVTQGEAAIAISMLSLGRVRLTRGLNDGKTLSLGYRGAGDVLGEAALGGVTTHRESAIATEDVEALQVPLQTFKSLMASDANFAAVLVSSLIERHTDTEERLASMLFRNVEARLCEFLLKAATRWGIPDPRGVLISAPFTHQEMASMIGSTRETVTLTLGELRRKGVIEIDRRRIVVLDRDALKSRI